MNEVKFIVTADSTCDFPEELRKELGVPVIDLTYTMDGKHYDRQNALSTEDFYAEMRKGKMPKTSQISPEDADGFFRELLKENRNIVHIGFSSALSGSVNSARVAAEELNAEDPANNIIVIDSLSASLGQGLLIYYVCKMRDEGKTAEEAAAWVEENKLHFCHNFTVDDLNHLHRGGRVSKATAIVGTMLGIKPVLHMDDLGRLIAVGKVRGRKQSLIALVDNMEKCLGSFRDKNEIFFISHGDCIEDAEFVAKLVEERFGIKKHVIGYVGTVIGAHSGPGTVALFFMGDHR